MEAKGRDGGVGGPSWSYRRRHEEIGSSSSYTISSSSRSGTIVSSAAYTSRSSRGLSSGISMEAAAALMELESDLRLDTPEPDKAILMELELELRLGTPEPDKKRHRKEIEEATLKETKTKGIQSLVQEFLGGGVGGGMSALERWFSELGVSWVLQLNVAQSATTAHGNLSSIDKTRNWIQALTQIMKTIRLTECFFPDHGHGFVCMLGTSDEEEVESRNQSLHPIQFALFFQQAMAKILIFVDVIFSQPIPIQGWLDRENLKFLLEVHRALSEVYIELCPFILQFHSSPRAEVEKIEREIGSLLSAKQQMAFDGIWSFMEEKRTRALKLMEDSLGAETIKASSDIHPVTCLILDHIRSLLYNCSDVHPAFVSEAASLGKYVPQIGLEGAHAFISMIAEMVSCLEEKLITKSQSFLDKGLGLLFLLNNSNFIRKQLQDSLDWTVLKSAMVNSQCNDLALVIDFITRNVEHYTENYIQVSWEPMLTCLFNPTPLRLVRKYSPLSMFESEFQKLYTTQKLWKVPDPNLRQRLRNAVIRKITPGYTKYIEDNEVNYQPKIHSPGAERDAARAVRRMINRLQHGRQKSP